MHVIFYIKTIFSTLLEPIVSETPLYILQSTYIFHGCLCIRKWWHTFLLVWFVKKNLCQLVLYFPNPCWKFSLWEETWSRELCSCVWIDMLIYAGLAIIIMLIIKICLPLIHSLSLALTCLWTLHTQRLFSYYKRGKQMIASYHVLEI